MQTAQSREAIIRQLLQVEQAELSRLQMEVAKRQSFIQQLRSQLESSGPLIIESPMSDSDEEVLADPSVSMRQKVETILRKSGREMRVAEIVSRLEAAGVTGTGGRTLVQMVYAAVGKDRKRFLAIDRGLYVLNEAKSASRDKMPPGESPEEN